MLSTIRYSEDQTIRLKDLAEQGVVVYVHRSKSILLHWILRKTIARLELPKVAFSAFQASAKVVQLIRVLKTNMGALELFLRKPNTAFSQKKSEKRDYIRTLIRLQKTLEKPIFMVPHLLILGTKTSSLVPSAVDMIFGTTGEPGFLRLFFRLIILARSAKWVSPEALNLKSFLEANSQCSDAVLSRKVRGVLLKRLRVLQRTYQGPASKSPQRIQLDTLRDHDLQQFMTNIETQTGLPKVKLLKKAQQYYKEIAARFDVDVIYLMNKVLSFVWSRIYDGIVWKASDIEKLKQASQKGPVILVPAHRSHMDYVVLSQILYWEGLMLPHIAAGHNLSFFPLGPIFRRGGAYFIRRSFKGGDPLYPQVMRAYIKHLLREGYTQEFFIEGGRSRNGKTLPPKLGLLSIMIDCLTKSKLSEATFIPISISYEKLLEANEYRRELEGAEKKVESRRDLLKSLKILKKRHGRVFVNFDDPISFLEFYQNHSQDVVKVLAHRIMSGIQRCTVITPISLVATAMLSSRRRILSRAQLEWSVKKIAHYVQIPKPDLNPVLESLLQDGLLVSEQASQRVYYRTAEKSTLSLDYYKNNLIHHFVADSILATAFMVSCEHHRRKIVKRSVLQKQAQILSQIFKFEFSYPAGISFEELFQARVQQAVDAKVMTRVQDHIRLNDTKEALEQLSFAVNLLANFVDAYWICAKKIESALTKAPTRKILSGILLDALKEAALSGVSSYPEIASKSLADNAILVFEDFGILFWEAGKAKMKVDKKEELKKIYKVLQDCHYGR